MGVEQQWLAAQWRKSEGNHPSFTQHNPASSLDSPTATSPIKETPTQAQTSTAMTVAPSGLSMATPLSTLGNALGKIGVGEERLTGARDTVQVRTCLAFLLRAELCSSVKLISGMHMYGCPLGASSCCKGKDETSTLTSACVFEGEGGTCIVVNAFLH